MSQSPPSKPPIARRNFDIAPFHVMELYKRARELESQGKSVIHMEVGEPDFPTPLPVLHAAQTYMESGDIYYTPPLGITPLREAISRFYENRYGVSIDPMRICITAGASAALTLIAALLINPGDEVLLPDPGYPCNRHIVRVFEGVPKALPVYPQNAYSPTTAQIISQWTDKTRALILASPSNPTGTVIEPKLLHDIATVVAAQQGWLIVDEIYHGLTYGFDAKTALEIDSNIFVVNSFSKYFNMTGWRLGWAVVPSEYVKQVEKLAANLYISPSTPAQYGAIAAFLPETIETLEDRRLAFQRRRDFLWPAIETLGFQVQAAPRGAFYLYANCKQLTNDSFALSQQLIEHAQIAVTPGIDFGTNNPQEHLRFAYTVSIEKLAQGIERLQSFLRI